MKIYTAKNRDKNLINNLIKIWENSVKSTNKFLNDKEILKIKQYVPTALKNVKNLVIAEINDKPVAFLGVENQKIEMLFVLTENQHQGIEICLINYAIKNFSANEVTVNEQNSQAFKFYLHLGFKTYKRTTFDEQGNPYPLLYMKL